MTKYPHKNGDYATSGFEPREYVPDGFEHDETIDFKKQVNYLYTDQDSENVWRVSVHKDNTLWTVWLYANNKEAGHSRGIECRNEEKVQDAYAELTEHLQKTELN